MTPRTGFALLLAGILTAAAGWYFGPGQMPGAAQDIDTGRLVFPGLTASLQNAAELDVTHQGKTLVIRRQGDSWGLADRGMYPVQTDKLRGVLTGLTELRLVEPRTSSPAEYARLGVDDPAGKDAGSNLVRVVDSSGKTIAELIVGHRRTLTQGNVPDQVYVRRPNEARSWLAEGTLSVDADPQLWLVRDIMNIDHAQVARIDVEHGDGKLAFESKSGKLEMTAPAEHKPLDQYKLDELARGLEQLSCEDIKPGPAAESGAIGQSVFTTADNKRITVHLFKSDKTLLARFDVAGDDKLERRVANWTYQLGTWKEAALAPTLADLEQKQEEKPATSGATQ